ncbi:hypothetical protein HGA13_01940 [Nocardia speluncae]|uniref:Uncharacterized protein n=1 Tax=Nocardia speluncae TaxID=419477 RepID=A0A846XAK4_9NOCA|nr:hypothetical protein [Nocardia speluncae]NKY31840.1 hypothetical protein [Nocardia speluncae]
MTLIERTALSPYLRARVSCGATLDFAHRSAPFVPELLVIDPIHLDLAA